MTSAARRLFGIIAILLCTPSQANYTYTLSSNGVSDNGWNSSLVPGDYLGTTLSGYFVITTPLLTGVQYFIEDVATSYAFTAADTNLTSSNSISNGSTFVLGSDGLPTGWNFTFEKHQQLSSGEWEHEYIFASHYSSVAEKQITQSFYPSGLYSSDHGNYAAGSWSVSSVPEPSTYLSMLIGFLAIAFMRKTIKQAEVN